MIAAIATPVDEDGAPDLARATKLARYLLDNGCDGLNVLGTTGEATSFSLDERKRVMSAYKAAGLPLDRLMVGTGAAAVADAVALTRHAAELGFAGALVLPPFYYKGVPDDGLVAYIDTIVKATAQKPIPIYLYHFPAHVRPALARRADHAAARHASVAASSGLKDSSGDMAYARAAAGDLEELRRVPLDRGRAARGARAALSPAASRRPPISTPISAQRAWSNGDTAALDARGHDPQAVRRQAAGLRASRRCSRISMAIRRWRG